MSPSLAALRREAADCRRCDLWKLGTQTVFGEGRRRGLMLVGEQPGDVEDREGELAAVDPALVVCLGATAAQALLGKDARVGKLRGRIVAIETTATPVIVTIHPSAVLRAGEERELRRAELATDLAFARDELRRLSPQTSKTAKS